MCFTVKKETKTAKFVQEGTLFTICTELYAFIYLKYMLPPWRDERRRDFWKCRPMWVGEKRSQQRWSLSCTKGGNCDDGVYNGCFPWTRGSAR